MSRSLSAHERSLRERGGLLIATSLDMCALNFGGTGLDPRIDTALGVPGRGRLTATGHIVSVRVSLPAGEIGLTASGHAGDYLPLGESGRLARRDQQEGAEAVVSQPPAVSEVSVAVPPAAGGAVFIVTSVCCAGSCQVLF